MTIVWQDNKTNGRHTKTDKIISVKSTVLIENWSVFSAKAIYKCTNSQYMILFNLLGLLWLANLSSHKDESNVLSNPKMSQI